MGLSRRNLSVACLLALFAFGEPLLFAQTTPAAPSRAAQARSLLEDEKYATARTEAERLLKENPDSIEGNFVLGCVQKRAEGSLAKAMFHLDRARELYETQYGQLGGRGDWQLHREILYELADLAGLVEDYEYQLQLLDYYDSLYDDLPAEHAWPLMKLGRLKEARKWATRALQSSDPWERSLGLNALCAIEGKAETRVPYADACKRAYDDAKSAPAPSGDSKGPGSAVDAYNAALAALAAWRFADAKEMLETVTSRIEFTPANPWRLLADLALGRGDIERSIEAMREMHRWKARQPADIREQDRAENDIAVATLVLVVGDADMALELITRAREQPDRLGLSSTTMQATLGGTAVLELAARRAALELREEKRSTGVLSWAITPLRRAWARITQIGAREKIVETLSDQAFLANAIRPYVHTRMERVPTWLLAEVFVVLDEDAADWALNAARKRDKGDAKAASYYDAFEAELRWRHGDEDEALRLGDKALRSLPAEEVLLKARVTALMADASMSNGKRSRAYSLYADALRLDPSITRRLGLALPAAMRPREGAIAASLAGALRWSPRFAQDDSGFSVAVSASEEVAEVCLRTPDGGLIRCAQVLRTRDDKGKIVEDLADFEQRVVIEAQASIFSYHSTKNLFDPRSLDGANTANQERSHQEMQELLDQAIQ